MAVTVAWVGHGRVDDCDDDTLWLALKVLGAGGGPSPAAADTIYQGAGAVTCVVSKQTVLLYFDIGVGNELDFGGGGGVENQWFHAWINFLAPGSLQPVATTQANGMGVYMDSTAPTTSRFNFWAFYDATNYFGGWKRLRIDPTKAPTHTTGSAPTTSSMRYFGIYAGVPGGTTLRFDNLIVDAIDVGTGIRCYGTSTDGDLKADLLADELTTRYGGFVSLNDDDTAQELGTDLTIGDSVGTSASTITMQDANVFMANPQYESDDTGGGGFVLALPVTALNILFQDNGTGTTDITMGVAVGTGDTATGRNGWSIIGNADYEVSFQYLAGDNWAMFGCKLQSILGLITLTSVTDELVQGNTFDNCAEVNPNGQAILRNNIFSNHLFGTDKAALFWVDSINIKNCLFISNDNAIRHGLGTSEAPSHDGLTFLDNTIDVQNDNSASQEISSAITVTADQILGNATIALLSQSFTTTGTPGDLSHVIFSLKKVGTPTGQLTVYLYAEASDIKTGAILATATQYYDPATDTNKDLLVEDLTASYVDYDIIFPSGENYNFVLTTKYVIELDYSGGGVSDYVHVEYDDNTGDNYTGGRKATDGVLDLANEDLYMLVRVNNWIHVSATNGSNPATHVGTQATYPGIVTITNAVNLTITVIDKDTKVAIADAQVIFEQASDGTILMDEDANGSGIATEAFNYPGSTVDCILRVRQTQDTDTPRYESFADEITIDSNGYTRTVQMQVRTF